MGELTFHAYKGKDLQNFLAILNQCEAESITDIRFVRERLQRHVDTQFADSRVRRVDMRKREGLPAQAKFETCPSCGNKSLRPASQIDGMQRLGCKCGYSKVI